MGSDGVVCAKLTKWAECLNASIFSLSVVSRVEKSWYRFGSADVEFLKEE